MGLLSELLTASMEGRVKDVVDRTRSKQIKPGEYGNRYDITPEAQKKYEQWGFDENGKPTLVDYPV